MSAFLQAWFRRGGANWLTLLVAAVAFVSLFASGAAARLEPWRMVVVTAGLIVYALLGTLGWSSAQESHWRAAHAVYFVLQFAACTLIVWAAQMNGATWLVLLPLVSHGAVALPAGWSLAVAGATLAVFSGTIALYAGPAAAFINGSSYLAAVLFVLVFTRMIEREQLARADAERLGAELAEANRKLREYAIQAEELATAKERNRLAREIHDSLGHYLTVINVQLAAAQAVQDSDPVRAKEAMHKAQTLAQEGLSDVRRSVAALRAAPFENRPLPEGIAALVADARAAGLAVTLHVSGDARALAPQAELTLYRAAQEALTNVRKHAGSASAEVTLDYACAGKVRLAVVDNGAGCAEPGGGFGLVGLRERAQLLGGTLRARSTAGQGFALEVELPA